MLVAGGGVRADAARLLRARRPRARGRRLGGRSCRRSTCPSATPSRCSTSARPPAACTATPAGVCEAVRRWGTVPLEELAAPAARLAREGVVLNAGQAYVAEILADLLTSTPECAALWAPGGPPPARGRAAAQPRARRGADAPGTRRRRAVLPRRHRGRGVRLAGRTAAARCARPTSPATERSSVAPVRDRLPRPRDPHQPAAVGGRDAARLRAGAARSRSGAADAASGRRRDGGRPVRAHARVRRRSRPGGLPRALPGRPRWAPPRTSR